MAALSLDRTRDRGNGICTAPTEKMNGGKAARGDGASRGQDRLSWVTLVLPYARLRLPYTYTGNSFIVNEGSAMLQGGAFGDPAGSCILVMEELKSGKSESCLGEKSFSALAWSSLSRISSRNSWETSRETRPAEHDGLLFRVFKREPLPGKVR